MIDAAESTQWGKTTHGGGRFLGWADGLGHVDVSEMMEHEDGTAVLGRGPPVRRPAGAEEDNVKAGKPAATPPGLKSQDGP